MSLSQTVTGISMITLPTHWSYNKIVARGGSFCIILVHVWALMMTHMTVQLLSAPICTQAGQPPPRITPHFGDEGFSKLDINTP